MRMALSLSILLLATACLATPTARFTPALSALDNYQATDPASVAVLKKKPTRRYRELGTINVEAYLLNSNEEMFDHVKAEAAKHGAHAVILYQGVKQDSIWTSASNGTPPKYASAIAIRYQ